LQDTKTYYHINVLNTL